MKLIHYKILTIILLLFSANAYGQKNKIKTDSFCSTIFSNKEYKKIKDLAILQKKQYQKNSESITNCIIPLKLIILRHTDGSGGFTQAQVISNIDQLNVEFGNTGFQFTYDEIVFIDDDFLFEDATYPSAINNYHNYVDNGTITIFYRNQGYSSQAFNKLTDTNFIVMNHPSSVNSLTHTITHEMGHLFGLLHTFQLQYPNDPIETKENVTRNPSNTCYNCETASDLICDTPADDYYSSSNAYGSSFSYYYNPTTGETECIYSSDPNNPNTDACNETYIPDTTNYMSYFGCRSRFTNGQINRMKFIFDNEMSYLNTNCSGDCISDITITQIVITGNSDVQESSSTITAINTIENGANAEYDTGISLTLATGFHAKLGSNFKAYIEGCVMNKQAQNKEIISNNVELKEGVSSIKLYPNPTSGSLNIDSIEAINSWTILDYYGKQLINNNSVNSKKTSLSISQLKTGIYFLRMQLITGKIITKRIVKN